MASTRTDPIDLDWTLPPQMPPSPSTRELATASMVAELIAPLSPAEVKMLNVEVLAAAASEVAYAMGKSVQFCEKDAPIALVRMIGKAAASHPDVSGPQTERLFQSLTESGSRNP